MTTDKPRPVPVSERAAKNHLYGCHVELLEGDEPDGCVLDYGAPTECLHARGRRTKWTCPYWRPRSDAGRK